MRSEFELINDIKSRYSLSKVGDDCAILPKDKKTDLLITSDMLVEGIDFRLDWSTPEQIGHKALAVSLSDIAATGGTPTHAMLSIGIVENLWKDDFLDRLYEGWHELALKFNVELIGGDISRTSGPLTIDSTVLGEVPKGKALLRSGAKPGDGVFVTGVLGGAAGGLRLLLDPPDVEVPPSPLLIGKQIKPMPQLMTGMLLQRHDLADAAIDLSDGLSSDLGHLCTTSRVGAEICADVLPIEPALATIFLPDECLDMALNGGEDFQLLFTGNEKKISAANIPHITRIGRITANAGIIELISGDTRARIEPRGYRHF
ncbi:MAG TPA: thiamine-phosphate kinase [Pyrinomonadaceae bacterium]|jgi:thiamine-monophosphate kinase